MVTSKLQSIAGTMPFEQSFFAWKVWGRHIVNVIKNCKRMLWRPKIDAVSKALLYWELDCMNSLTALTASRVTHIPRFPIHSAMAMVKYVIKLNTGCFYKLSKINLVWGPLKCTKSNFNPVHLFLHFKSFCLVVLQLILA